MDKVEFEKKFKVIRFQKVWWKLLLKEKKYIWGIYEVYLTFYSTEIFYALKKYISGLIFYCGNKNIIKQGIYNKNRKIWKNIEVLMTNKLILIIFKSEFLWKFIKVQT